VPKNKSVVYNVTSGAILLTTTAPVSLLVLTDQEGVLETTVEKIAGYYVNLSPLELRPKHSFAMGKFVGDDYHIDLPKGTSVVWQGGMYLSDDETTEILVDQPSKHELSLHHPHYLDAEIFIENPNFD
jgi:hypothetical protein